MISKLPTILCFLAATLVYWALYSTGLAFPWRILLIVPISYRRGALSARIEDRIYQRSSGDY